MSSKNDCEIVKDLLPNYIESLTSRATNDYIKNHIKNCPNCANTLKNMNGELLLKDIYEEKEIDFLKMLNKKNTIFKRSAISLLIITIILTIIIVIFIIPNYLWIIDENGNIDIFHSIFGYNYSSSNVSYYVATQTITDSEISENEKNYTKIYILQLDESTNKIQNYKLIVHGVTKQYINDITNQLAKFLDISNSKISNLQHNNNSYSYNIGFENSNKEQILNEMLENDDDKIIEIY